MCLIFLAVFSSYVFPVPKTSSFFTMYSSFMWMLGHSSRICCWVCGAFLHALHVRFSYLPLELFFMPSILVLALKMWLTWGLVSWSMYGCLTWGFHSPIPSSRCLTFDLSRPSPSILFFNMLFIFWPTFFLTVSFSPCMSSSMEALFFYCVGCFSPGFLLACFC